ncbi:hypothetical protein ALT1545_20291 [Alteromonas macleodii]
MGGCGNAPPLPSKKDTHPNCEVSRKITVYVMDVFISLSAQTHKYILSRSAS